MTVTDATTWPKPHVGPDTAPFWEYARSHELRVQRCFGCGALRWPPGPVCARCFSDDSDWVAVSGRGELQSWVVYRREYHEAFPVPFAVGLVELEEGPRIEAPLLDGEPAWRMPVELVWREYDGFSVPAFRRAAP
jgi:uncharacterized OB-fold protein